MSRTETAYPFAIYADSTLDSLEYTMIHLRNFEQNDSLYLQEHCYQDSTKEDIESRISNWNTKKYEGNYFEMFAIVAESKIVGMVSLYQHSNSVISCGPEIFPEHRQKGYAFHAVNLGLDIARKKGYKIAVAQIRTDNEASIALHKKLGFETQGYVYQNRKGNEVYIFLKSLVD